MIEFDLYVYWVLVSLVVVVVDCLDLFCVCVIVVWGE